MNKRKWLFIALAALCISIIGYGTTAFFTADDIAHNFITTGNVEIELHEEGPDGKPFPEDGISGIMPGTEVTKKVTVENTGDSECWVRIKVEKAIQLAEGNEGEPDAALIELDIDKENWTEQDGWYYYNNKLTPGENTLPLFTKAVFSEEMDNMYKNSTANVTVAAQAVQCANNGETVLDAAGWPALAE